MRTILVINLKGGCGKTTVATHIAAAMARSGSATGLADLDRQGSARRWLKLRPARAEAIQGLDWSKALGKPPRRVDRLILDSPAGLRGDALTAAVNLADCIVAPILPSVFDEMATDRFLKRIDKIKAVAKGATPTLLVANRYRPNSIAGRRLEAYIAGAGRSLTARIVERALYADLATQGLTLFDQTTASARRIQEEWMPLLESVDRA